MTPPSSFPTVDAPLLPETKSRRLRAALIDGRPQTLLRNPDGAFQLFRIGDAVASRNVHAGIYDALRLMKDL